MKRTTRATLALVLAWGLFVQLSAQAAAAWPDMQRGLSPIASETRSPVPSTIGLPIHQQPQVLAARSGNPPAAVRQPGSRTRLITAIVFVAGLVAVGVIFQHRN